MQQNRKAVANNRYDPYNTYMKSFGFDMDEIQSKQKENEQKTRMMNQNHMNQNPHREPHQESTTEFDPNIQTNKQVRPRLMNYFDLINNFPDNRKRMNPQPPFTTSPVGYVKDEFEFSERNQVKNNFNDSQKHNNIPHYANNPHHGNSPQNMHQHNNQNVDRNQQFSHNQNQNWFANNQNQGNNNFNNSQNYNNINPHYGNGPQNMHPQGNQNNYNYRSDEFNHRHHPRNNYQQENHYNNPNNSPQVPRHTNNTVYTSQQHHKQQREDHNQNSLVNNRNHANNNPYYEHSQQYNLHQNQDQEHRMNATTHTRPYGNPHNSATNYTTNATNDDWSESDSDSTLNPRESRDNTYTNTSQTTFNTPNNNQHQRNEYKNNPNQGQNNYVSKHKQSHDNDLQNKSYDQGFSSRNTHQQEGHNYEFTKPKHQNVNTTHTTYYNNTTNTPQASRHNNNNDTVYTPQQLNEYQHEGQYNNRTYTSHQDNDRSRTLLQNDSRLQISQSNLDYQRQVSGNSTTSSRLGLHKEESQVNYNDSSENRTKLLNNFNNQREEIIRPSPIQNTKYQQQAPTRMSHNGMDNDQKQNSTTRIAYTHINDKNRDDLLKRSLDQNEALLNILRQSLAANNQNNQQYQQHEHQNNFNQSQDDYVKKQNPTTKITYAHNNDNSSAIISHNNNHNHNTSQNIQNNNFGQTHPMNHMNTLLNHGSHQNSMNHTQGFNKPHYNTPDYTDTTVGRENIQTIGSSNMITTPKQDKAILTEENVIGEDRLSEFERRPQNTIRTSGNAAQMMSAGHGDDTTQELMTSKQIKPVATNTNTNNRQIEYASAPLTECEKINTNQIQPLLLNNQDQRGEGVKRKKKRKSKWDMFEDHMIKMAEMQQAYINNMGGNFMGPMYVPHPYAHPQNHYYHHGYQDGNHQHMHDHNQNSANINQNQNNNHQGSTYTHNQQFHPNNPYQQQQWNQNNNTTNTTQQFKDTTMSRGQEDGTSQYLGQNNGNIHSSRLIQMDQNPTSGKSNSATNVNSNIIKHHQAHHNKEFDDYEQSKDNLENKQQNYNPSSPIQNGNLSRTTPPHAPDNGMNKIQNTNSKNTYERDARFASIDVTKNNPKRDSNNNPYLPPTTLPEVLLDENRQMLNSKSTEELSEVDSDNNYEDEASSDTDTDDQDDHQSPIHTVQLVTPAPNETIDVSQQLKSSECQKPESNKIISQIDNNDHISVTEMTPIVDKKEEYINDFKNSNKHATQRSEDSNYKAKNVFAKDSSHKNKIVWNSMVETDQIMDADLNSFASETNPRIRSDRMVKTRRARKRKKRKRLRTNDVGVKHPTQMVITESTQLSQQSDEKTSSSYLKLPLLKINNYKKKKLEEIFTLAPPKLFTIPIDTKSTYAQQELISMQKIKSKIHSCSKNQGKTKVQSYCPMLISIPDLQVNGLHIIYRNYITLMK